jgi:starvation-inducible DNA-binding protein
MSSATTCSPGGQGNSIPCHRILGLKACPLTLAEERGHVEALSSALAAYGTSIRRAIEQADALGDKDTADICTEISRGIDKYLWFVEAHLG